MTSMYDAEAKKGEIYELKAELNSDKRDRKKEAVKKVIASMTVGKDVRSILFPSQLFPDVVNCMQTDNLELKKLVYLYLMNYAKTQPDMAILAVNTFAKDCNDPNPLIRALAVRTMGCIRVDKITEHLCEPLRKCLKDEDPYVRKTAAVCVAKLHDINQQLVEDQGFLDMLRDLISDSNPMVVANAVAALSEIAEASPQIKVFDLNTPTINKLLTALNECTEWGQIFILDAISNYSPRDEKEAQSICERVTPRLAHANSAVVLSAVKVLMKFLELIDQSSEFVQNTHRKLAPPLVTLLSAEPELQYVALRNINLIVQKRADILKNEMKVFFVKYNDPVYVKLEKLDIMIRLTNASNIAQVLAELKEYSTEVDVDFVRKSVRAIGRCAIKVESAAERCVSTLIDLIQTKVNYVVQEAIVVIKDIFRKYPNKYESIIATLCENLDSLDEPEARASMIWIIGEYAERIDNADELLESFLDGFKDENNQVQLQLLTAIVKLFLKKPSETPQELVTRVLTLVTQDSDNPDLRDRGYIYWRLLSTDPKAAKEVVLAEKPLISEETDLLEPTLLDELICHIGSLASVYHKPPNAFVEGRQTKKKNLPLRSSDANYMGTGAGMGDDDDNDIMPPKPAQQQTTVITNNTDLLIGDFDILGSIPTMNTATQSNHYNPSTSQHAPSSVPNLLDDELSSILGTDLYTHPSTTQVTSPIMGNISNTTTELLGQLFGDLQLGGGMGSLSSSGAGAYVPPKEVWLSAHKGKGLEVSGTFSRRLGHIVMDMTFENKALQPMSDFALQLNRNSFGLTPANPLQITTPLFPNQTSSTQLQLNTNAQILKMDPLTNLQVAIKNNIDFFFFACIVPIQVYFTDDGEMDKMQFVQAWQNIPENSEIKHQIQNTHSLSIDDIQTKLRLNNIHTITRTTIEQNEMLYQTMKLTNGIWILCELKITPGNKIISLERQFSGAHGAIRCIRYNIDGNYCLTSGSDRTIKLWKPDSNLSIKTYTGHSQDVLDIQSSFDNSRICSGGMDKRVLYIDVVSGKIMKKFHAHAGRVHSVKFNEEATVIISASIDGTVKLWDVKSRDYEPVQILDDAKDSVTSLCLGNNEILTSSLDQRIRIYDIRYGKLYQDYIGHNLTFISLSHDQQCFLISTLSSQLLLFDKVNGKLLQTYHDYKNNEYMIENSFSNDDQYVYSGSENGRLICWNLLTAKQVFSLEHEKDNKKSVNTLAHHPKENKIITAQEGMIYVWKEKENNDDDVNEEAFVEQKQTVRENSDLKKKLLNSVPTFVRGNHAE
ncbi:unnamed protein product [Didymodactylos carnosus]|uniref:AP complex subunit beta n=1 Tax=Didymodactylos carnosus TaxID=1234261 RepID=A0A814BNK3_9BILA|nr:unnamed protein product [Didymodactylos carnosus]CAF0943456.1 unnamed protein product [Didymodactylos carnosus]CAF3707476.1 unnamed protein product [Didymodactylos carnosus]CAF3718261.1 unnamed protein product [Didymodactylos carnosus]